jgi:hypothetical protein
MIPKFYVCERYGLIFANENKYINPTERGIRRGIRERPAQADRAGGEDLHLVVPLPAGHAVGLLGAVGAVGGVQGRLHLGRLHVPRGRVQHVPVHQQASHRLACRVSAIIQRLLHIEDFTGVKA